MSDLDGTVISLPSVGSGGRDSSWDGVAEMIEDGALATFDHLMSKFSAPTFDSLVWQDWTRLPVNEQIKLPTLAKLTLEWGCDARALAVPDKTLWSLGFAYSGVNMVLTSEKFGPRLYVNDERKQVEGHGTIAHESMLSDLRGAMAVMEFEVLPELAEEQVRAGLCTLPNNHARIRSMYEYFRSGANDAATVRAEEPHGGPDLSASFFANALGALSASMSASREVRYNRFAAVTSYFSWLEHVLTLMLSMADFDPSRDDLPAFTRKKWGEKWERIFPRTDPESMRMYNLLRELAEDERNHHARGGLDRGETLWFHTPRFGALPVSLTKFDQRPSFRYVELNVLETKSVTQDVWDKLDAVDEWIRSGKRRFAMAFIDAGLDVPFDPKFRREFDQASCDEESFTDWLDAQAAAADQAANFE